MLRPLLIYFGYAKQEGVENKFGFIEIGDLTEDEKLEYNGFMRENEEHMKLSLKYGDKIGDVFKFDNGEGWKSIEGAPMIEYSGRYFGVGVLF